MSIDVRDDSGNVHSFPDGSTPEQISDALRTFGASQSGPFGRALPGPAGYSGVDPRGGASVASLFHGAPVMGEPGAVGDPSRSGTGLGVSAPAPMHATRQMMGMVGGGILGGLVGGPPGALTGAGIGAAAGRNADLPEGTPLPQRIHEASGAGLAGMATEGAGQFIVNPLTGMLMANPLMQYAIRGTPEEAATALQLRTGVGKRLTPGAEGVDVASDVAGAQKQRVLDLVQQAENTGHRFDHRQFLPTLQSLIKRGDQNALTNEDRDAFQQMLDTYTEKYGPRPVPAQMSKMIGLDGQPMTIAPASVTAAKPLLPTQVQAIKEEAQNAIKDYYARMEKQGVSVKASDAYLRANKQIASTAQGMLEGLPGVGSDIAKANAASGDATAVKGLLTQANKRPLSLTNAGVAAAPLWLASHNPSVAAAGALLSQPWVASRLALGMTSPLGQQAIAQVPPALLGMMPNRVMGDTAQVRQ